MKVPNSFVRLKGFRFPREIIAYAVWAYYRFAMSTADVEDLLTERGIIVSRETVRLWENRFGSHFADCIRRDRPKPNNKWHLDEVVITICGLNTGSGGRLTPMATSSIFLFNLAGTPRQPNVFFKKLVRLNGEPRVVATDKLRSYTKPVKTLAPEADHRAHKGLNNTIENSHRPTRKREKIMGRFKSLRQAQRFLSNHDQINIIFHPHRYKLSSHSYHHARADAFALWPNYIAEMTA